MSFTEWIARRFGRTPMARGRSFSVVTQNPSAWAKVRYNSFDVVPSIEAARGDYLLLHPEGYSGVDSALLGFSEALSAAPDADYLFADEFVAGMGVFHKPGWSPSLLLSQPYAAGVVAVRRDLAMSIGGLRSGLGAASSYDFALRATAAASRVVHVPAVLSHRQVKTVVGTQHQDAAAEAASCMGLAAEFERWESGRGYSVSVRPSAKHAITIIVPTRDRLDLIGPCVESVLACDYRHDVRVLIVDNGSVEPATLAQFREWENSAAVSVLRDDAPFDYSALMNKAVAAAETPLVVLLNNDTAVISSDWLDQLVGWMELQDVGAVGAKLYHDDDTIQHAGVVLGIGGVASHGHKGFARSSAGYHDLLHSVRDCSAVTAACMLTRRDVYLELGGMEPDLRVAYNDIDYCLRIRSQGKRVLWTPRSELYHFEGKSRGKDKHGQSRFEREFAFMRDRWSQSLDRDPFYNPNLSLRAVDYRLR
jgi:O-antigen biosynthesis protein